MTMTHGKMKPKIDEEMDKAFDSRAEKKEGRARVSARRAAGFAISSYFEDCTGESSTKSAFHLLSWLQDREEISAEVREAARRLTVHVTPDHILPHSEDPLVDAKTIIVAMAEITTEDLEGKSTSLVSGVAGGLTYLARIPQHEPSMWIVMLHGLGGNEESMWVLDTSLPEDALILSLRGIFPLGPDSYSWVNPSMNGWPTVMDFAPAIKAMELMIQELEDGSKVRVEEKRGSRSNREEENN